MRSRPALIAFLSCLLLLVGALVYLRPFWGLQDDGNFLPSADYFMKIGLWEGIKEVVAGDWKWGMIRPYMGALIVFLYGWTKETTFYTHMLNLTWVIGVHWYFYWAVLNSPMGKTFTGNSKSRLSEHLAIASLISLALPWMHWYFLIPAMQEKVVLLWAAISIHWLSTKRARESSTLAFSAAAFLITILGAITKAQFLVLGPLFVAAVWQAKAKHALTKNLVVFALFCLAGLILKWVANQGIYTKSYGISAIWENLHNTRAFFPLMLIALAHCLGSIWLIQKYEKRAWSEAFTLCAPALAMAAFLLIMLPWRLGGYLYAAIIPFLALIAATWFFRINNGLLKTIAITALFFSAFSMTGWRIYKQWLPLRDLRQIIEIAKNGGWPKDATKVWNSCQEGHSHLNYYLKEFGGLKDVEVLLANEKEIAAQPLQHPSKKIYWLVQKEWCPIVENSDVMDPSTGKHILGGTLPASFQLVSFDSKTFR